MSTLQVNTINESTSASGVTIDGVNIKDGGITTDLGYADIGLVIALG